MKVEILKVRRLIPLLEGIREYRVYYETDSGIKGSVDVYGHTLKKEHYLMTEIIDKIEEDATDYKKLAKELEGKVLEREVK